MQNSAAAKRIIPIEADPMLILATSVQEQTATLSRIVEMLASTTVNSAISTKMVGELAIEQKRHTMALSDITDRVGVLEASSRKPINKKRDLQWYTIRSYLAEHGMEGCLPRTTRSNIGVRAKNMSDAAGLEMSVTYEHGYVALQYREDMIELAIQNKSKSPGITERRFLQKYR